MVVQNNNNVNAQLEWHNASIFNFENYEKVQQLVKECEILNQIEIADHLFLQLFLHNPPNISYFDYCIFCLR